MRFLYIKKPLFIGILFIGFIARTFAQNLPQIQNVNVGAPSNIKIDGQLKEWSNQKLSAYNSANRIYYVVSNDDDYLYLTVRGSGTVAANKILKEGIKFTVSHSIEKSKRNKDPQNVSVTYPTSQDGRIVIGMMAPVNAAAEFLKDTVKYRKQLDSTTAIINAGIEKHLTEIKITGIKEIKDTILSIYNDVGIKAVLRFSKGEPIIEMAIPLKYLDLKITSPLRFSYNIKLSAPPMTGNFDIHDLLKKGEDVSSIPPDILYKVTDTDLWGEYTLAKKP